MSTLEKAIGLLQDMPERKLEAVYMYMRFVLSHAGDDELIPSPSERMNPHEHSDPLSAEKEGAAFENASTGRSVQENSVEERLRGFQGLLSFAGTLPEDFDYRKELEEMREEKYASNE